MNNKEKDFCDKLTQRLVSELKKFLEVYKKLSGVDIDLELVEYKDLISILGRYINIEYKSKEWLNDVIKLGDGIDIKFKVFKGTEYETRVENFLESIFLSFNENDISNELDSYFNSSACIFNRIEVHICTTFYTLVNEINKNTIKNMFDRTVCDKELKESIKNFDTFVSTVARDGHNSKVLFEFDKIIKALIIEKKRTEILF